MKEVQFKQLTLTDWRAQTRTIGFSRHTLIKGRNESGKSTTWDAILWLFTGYDSLDRSNYQLFDNHVVPTKENAKPASVELMFTVDGMDYRLKRTAEMGWSRPRGAANYEKKSSDDYKFEIDGVEVPSSTYKDFIEKNFCPIEKMKFILNIDYYLMLDWKELRKHFADIIGDVTKEDYKGDFTEALALIAKYGTIDAAKEYLKAQRKPLRDAIGDNSTKGTKIVELETLQSTLPDMSGIEETEKRYKEIESEIAMTDKDIAGATESIKPLIEKRNAQLAEIGELESELTAIQNRILSDYRQKENELVLAIREVDSINIGIDNENRVGLRRIHDAENGIKALESKMESMTRYREKLLAQKNEVKSLTFKDEKCPYCGQPLPMDKLEEALDKFNRQKEAKYNAIVAEGKENKARMESCQKEIDALRAVISEGYEKKELKSKADLEAKLTDLRNSNPKVEQSIEYKEKSAEIARKRANIEDVPAVDVSAFEERKKRLYAELRECSERLSEKTTYERTVQRMDTLRKDIAAIAESLARIEGQMAQIDDMEQQKAEIVRHRVSALFSRCDIRMEERKKDGTMTPSCSILMNGVLVQVANTASKIEAGTDISDAFCKFYGVNMPLILDNRERVDDTKDFAASGRQTIELKREDCNLTIMDI